MNKIGKLNEAFENMVLKYDLWKTKVIISGHITMNGLSKNINYPCGICDVMVRPNTALFVK